jgi:hypothetical protein
MFRWAEDVYVEIEGRRCNIRAAMSVMRGIAFRRPFALARLPDDMVIGDPSGFDMRAVEKDSKPLSAFADNSAHFGPSNFSPSPGCWPRSADAIESIAFDIADEF